MCRIINETPAGGQASLSPALSENDRGAYLDRVAEIDRRTAAGESITEIMAEERRATLDLRLAEIARHGAGST